MKRYYVDCTIEVKVQRTFEAADDEEAKAKLHDLLMEDRRAIAHGSHTLRDEHDLFGAHFVVDLSGAEMDVQLHGPDDDWPLAWWEEHGDG